MAIFGMPDEPITWEKFLSLTTDQKYSESWREAITSVVMSTFPDRVNVDNSLVIFSSDEVKSYRVILTSATRYYNDVREFSVYFVETLHRTDYGDSGTSALLKGLELVCRFRFMFLETDSQFSHDNVLAVTLDRIPELAGKLVRELNQLRKDSRDANMDEPAVWRTFVSWDHIRTMASAYRPRESE